MSEWIGKIPNPEMLKTIGDKVKKGVNENLDKEKSNSPNSIIESLSLSVASSQATKKRLEVFDFKLTIIMRLGLTGILLFIVVAWMIWVGKLVFLNGLNYAIKSGLKGFYLSDNVMIALLTTTTANIIGLLVIVTRYFFPNNDTPNSK